jgi:N5-(carboxyethyl)ornithine synthase
MKKIGFITSSMPDETRVALMPGDLDRIGHPERLYFEEGYGRRLGIADGEYARRGANIVRRHETAGLEVLCVPRPHENDRDVLRKSMTIWGWPYIEDNAWCAQAVVDLLMTVIDFHFMYDNGAFVFRENSRIAGRIGLMQAMVMGRPPEQFGRVAVVGKGCLGRGAMEILDALGVPYALFDSKNSGELLRSIHAFDTIVNCIKWYEEGFFITREHIARMREGSFIVDLSEEGIEGSVPQPLHAPVYASGHVLMYSNDHIPALCPAYSSQEMGKALSPFIDKVTEESPDPVLEGATVVVDGRATPAAGKLLRAALRGVS